LPVGQQQSVRGIEAFKGAETLHTDALSVGFCFYDLLAQGHFNHHLVGLFRPIQMFPHVAPRVHSS